MRRASLSLCFCKRVNLVGRQAVITSNLVCRRERDTQYYYANVIQGRAGMLVLDGRDCNNFVKFISANRGHLSATVSNTSFFKDVGKKRDSKVFRKKERIDVILTSFYLLFNPFVLVSNTFWSSSNEFLIHSNSLLAVSCFKLLLIELGWHLKLGGMHS